MNRIPLLVPLAFACGCDKPPAPPDTHRILGEWVVVDFHSPLGTEDRGQRRKHTVVTDGTWSQQFQGAEFQDFEYSIDASKVPKHLDLTYTDPSARRLVVRGIYELTTDEHGDRLRVCFGSPPIRTKNGKTEYVESVRPTAFEPKDGPVIAYRRKAE